MRKSGVYLIVMYQCWFLCGDKCTIISEMQVRDTGELCTILQLSCKSEIILK